MKKKHNYRNLIKYPLSYDRVINFFTEQLASGRTLSHLVLEKISFEKGFFFTLLPKKANTDRLYDFEFGGMLKQTATPKRFHFQSLGECTGYQIPNIDSGLTNFTVDFLALSNLNSAIFEYAIASKNDTHIINNQKNAVFYKDEVYYQMTAENSSEQVLQAVKRSGQVWHFLEVLTEGIPRISDTFEMDDLLVACQNARYVVAGAYDGEGYIFWENTPDHSLLC